MHSYAGTVIGVVGLEQLRLRPEPGHVRRYHHQGGSRWTSSGQRYYCVFVVHTIPTSYRNLAAAEMHAFLTRDGTPPLEFINQAREQLNRYGFAKYVDGKLVSAEKIGKGFEVKLEDSTKYTERKRIIATGAKDVFLPIDGTPSI
jgi:thioredoxin reductase